MTPMKKVFALFIDAVDNGWGKPVLALFKAEDDGQNDWPGYHLWVYKRHFQVWPVNRRFLKTWS